MSLDPLGVQLDRVRNPLRSERRGDRLAADLLRTRLAVCPSTAPQVALELDLDEGALVVDTRSAKLMSVADWSRSNPIGGLNLPARRRGAGLCGLRARRALGAARQRLDPDRPAAGVQVEHARVADISRAAEAGVASVVATERLSLAWRR